jgi:hypothetical protein
LLKAIGAAQMFGRPLIDKKALDFAYAKHTKKICKTLKEERTKIQNGIWQLFDNLLPIYVEKSIALHEKWKTILEKELERRKNLRS